MTFVPRIDHCDSGGLWCGYILFYHKMPELTRCMVEALISGTPIVGYGTQIGLTGTMRVNRRTFAADTPHPLSLLVSWLSSHQ
jgi:hypothetical protein